MRKLFYLFALVLALAWLPSASQAQEKPHKKGTGITITGCLQRGDEANEFMMTGSNGKKYELISDKVSLSEHVGHTVTVTGMHARDKGEAAEHEKKEAGEREYAHLKVTSLKMVSESCK